jgi:hypothetical protein
MQYLQLEAENMKFQQKIIKPCTTLCQITGYNWVFWCFKIKLNYFERILHTQNPEIDNSYS